MWCEYEPHLDAERGTLAYRAGLCILPVAPNGTKRPDVPTWTGYQTARPTAQQRDPNKIGHNSQRPPLPQDVAASGTPEPGKGGVPRERTRF
jgi:hypothetical protein